MDGSSTIGALRGLVCAQCGRPVPDEGAELERWRYGRLAAAGELDEVSAAILLCPDCRDDAVLGRYDVGEVD